MLFAFFLMAGLSVNSQTILTIEGQTYMNTEDTWYGVIIPRSAQATFTFRNNSITSINRYGYLIEAGDEVPNANNNNLDGAVITGNTLTWNGTPAIGIIPHGIFTGYNINVKVKYNYLNKVPMAIVRKSNGMTDVSGVVAYNIIKDPGIGVVVKGMNGVRIYNNTFYNSLTTEQTNRALIDIYENPSVTPPGSATGTKIYNNIFYTKNAIKNISVSTDGLAGFECDYNIYYCEAGTPIFSVSGVQKTFAQWQALGYDIHSVVINPNFKDFINFVPAVRLDYGKDLGSELKDGLSVNAKWGASNPETTVQNGKWQVGAVVYAEPVEVPVPVPLYSGSSIANNTPAILEMTYNLTLANIAPAFSAFSVKVNSVARTVSMVAISGAKVLLTLASPVVYGDIVTVAYTKPASSPLQTASGGQAATISAQAVSNNCAQPANQSPVINIVTPTKSTSFLAPATITIDAAASDPDGTVTKVEFYNGTAKLGEKTTTPYSFTWKEVPEGTYSLTAVATDNLNSQTVSDPVTAIVEKAAPAINQLPVINISSPENESSFEAPTKITLTADASDSDGTVSKVEYFNSNIKIGESFSAPWQVSFDCIKTGTYDITAVVTDNLNAASTSAAVKISVTLKSKYPDIINLYPNPNSGRFSIDISSPLPDEENTVIISTLSGQAVYYGAIEEEKYTMQFDISHTPTGKYILIITSGNRIITTKKFIKN
jgi:uncharacterized repeat protein (TIGR02059 family)